MPTAAACLAINEDANYYPFGRWRGGISRGSRWWTAAQPSPLSPSLRRSPEIPTMDAVVAAGGQPGRSDRVALERGEAVPAAGRGRGQRPDRRPLQAKVTTQVDPMKP